MLKHYTAVMFEFATSVYVGIGPTRVEPAFFARLQRPATRHPSAAGSVTMPRRPELGNRCHFVNLFKPYSLSLAIQPYSHIHLSPSAALLENPPSRWVAGRFAQYPVSLAPEGQDRRADAGAKQQLSPLDGGRHRA